MKPSPSYAPRAFVVGNLVLAALLLCTVMRGFGRDSWVLTVSSCALVSLLLWSALGLVFAARWRLLAVRACALTELALGLAAITGLTIAAYRLGDTAVAQESLRPGVTLSRMLGVALLLPYVLVYPAIQLLWLQREQQYAAP